MHRAAFPLLILPLFAFVSVAGAVEEGEKLFSAKVWPIFKSRCLACHGDDPKKIKGGFDMRTRESFAQGGDSGDAPVRTGAVAESPLIRSVLRNDTDFEAMPPKENDRLESEQIAALTRWVELGAPWPDESRLAELAKSMKPEEAGGEIVQTSGGLSPDWTNRRYKPEDLWAYRPLRKATVPPHSGHPIDAFLAARSPAGVTPASRADRRTLIRRATFDLLGLPPKPEDVSAFLADSSPEEVAFAKVVERLLVSPHYGEKWGQHWLDVVRYADSSGFANDYARGNAWRYRDYVIRAFNNDKPYDRFIREQIAGDELDANDPELLVAVGFLRMGPWELTGMEVPKVARQRFLDDVTNSVGETFLAHSLQCARCHDHKFDPVPTRDYYGFQAIFATTQLSERPANFLASENTGGFEERKYLEQRRTHYQEILNRLDKKSLAAVEAWFSTNGGDYQVWKEVFAEESKRENKGKRRNAGLFERVRTAMKQRGIAEDRYPPKHLGFSPEDFGHERIARKGLERLAWEFDRYEPFAFSVYSGRTPDLKAVYAPLRPPAKRLTAGELEQTAILTGGDPFSPAARVEPLVLSAANTLGAPQLAATPLSAEIEGRRAALARWISAAENPLTARVMVNRIWLWHFGQALAGNPNNFGATGKKPTPPELLDWLAATFIERGWSVKEMHRVIMSSEAYCRSSSHPDPKTLAERGPEGAGYAVFPPRRLTAEEMRDAMLQVSGELNPAQGGIPIRPEMNMEAALQPRQVMGTFAEAWQPSPLPEQRHRRSIYTLKIRGQLDPFYEVFNAPSPDLSCERRDASTVTPQVFSLFNSQASYNRALAFASRLLKEAAGREAVIERAFQLAFSRAPKPSELQRCLAHWKVMTERHQSLRFEKAVPPKEVVREAVEENTGEKFSFIEPLEVAADFVSDLQPADASAETRGLAEVCLVLLNSNEFAYLY